MGLPQRGRDIASRLIPKAETKVSLVTVTSTPGATEFDPPSLSESLVTVDAVVTGAGRWADGETVLISDLSILVPGGSDVLDVGGVIKVDGKNHKIIQVHKIMAAGFVSAVRYIVRAG